MLFVGRVSPEKGVHVLIRAFQKVVEHFPEAYLEVVGPTTGPVPFEFVVALSDDEKVRGLSTFYDGKCECHYFPRLQKDLVDLNLGTKVKFHGSLSQSELVNYYQGASVFVFPSVWNEPFGIPLVEAMACEVPVVASRCGGMTEIVEHGKSGLLVERDNPEALADAVCRLLDDEGLRRSMGKAGRERVLARFSWGKISACLQEQYGAMYEEEKEKLALGKSGL